MDLLHLQNMKNTQQFTFTAYVSRGSEIVLEVIFKTLFIESSCDIPTARRQTKDQQTF